MELVPGQTLRQIIRSEGRLEVGRAIDVAVQLADALELAHRHGVLHCDVKPHNVIVTPSGQAKLVDFGIARAATASGTLRADEIAGSVPYLAPEQVSGARVDARTDVYALGIVLYAMLTGRTPFEADTVSASLAQRLNVDPIPPRAIDPALPSMLERVVMHALERDPNDRVQTAGRLATDLQTVAQHTVVAATRPLPVQGRAQVSSARPPLAVAVRVARDRPRMLFVAVLALVAIGLAFAAWLRSEPLPGDGWARFAERACEWSNEASPPGECFGQREQGYRIRVMQRDGGRWLIWDPETRGVAYVDAKALAAE
jgi:serine/threonine-protein kinase